MSGVDDIVQIHIAGPTLTYDGIRRQRCSWCGALIQEYDLNNISRELEPGEDPDNPEPWEPASWAVGDEVAAVGVFPRTSWSVDTEFRDGVPIAHNDSCMRIDLEVTR